MSKKKIVGLTACLLLYMGSSYLIGDIKIYFGVTLFMFAWDIQNDLREIQ